MAPDRTASGNCAYAGEMDAVHTTLHKNRQKSAGATKPTAPQERAAGPSEGRTDFGALTADYAGSGSASCRGASDAWVQR